MARFPYELMPLARRKLSDEELQHLADGFGKSRPLPESAKGGVPKSVWPQMITATADRLAERDKK